jgi:hypothetical protein
MGIVRKNINRSKAVDYALLFLLVGCTGIPFFKVGDITFLIISLCLAIIVFIYRKLRFDRFFFLFFLVYLMVMVAQMVKFNYLPVNTYLGVFIRIFFAYFTVRILGRNFTKYYVDIIYVLSIIGFFIYVPQLILPGFGRFLATSISPLLRNPLYTGDIWYAPDIILYVFNSGVGTFRNCGAFWEPGAYAGFLIIAMIFNFMESRTISDKKSIVLLLALLSTFSTTGLIALGFFLVMFLGNKVAPIYKLILIPSIFAAIVIAFTSLDFLGDKITSQLDVENTHHNTRFKSAVLDWRDFVENPVLGLGRDPKTRHKGITNPILTHRTNGLTNYLVTYGIFVFLFYFGSIYYAFHKLCLKNNYPLKYALYGLILILIIGFSEVFFSLPFFYGLAMLHMAIEVPVQSIVYPVRITSSS